MKQLLQQSYISMIKNSIGTNMFKNNFFESNGKKVDIVKNGSDSCAYFVSSVLKIFGLIKNIHATVDGTIKDIVKYGWKEYKGKEIPLGAILVWEVKNGHKHIGFYVGNNKAISNSSNKKEIAKHSLDYNSKRNIEKIYVNSILL
ncbi:MAG: NlpC/P60 family protein [Candidatus Absconditicoccaceae bacterium]